MREGESSTFAVIMTMALQRGRIPDRDRLFEPDARPRNNSFFADVFMLLATAAASSMYQSRNSLINNEKGGRINDVFKPGNHDFPICVVHCK